MLLYEPAGAHSIVRSQLEELNYVGEACIPLVTGLPALNDCANFLLPAATCCATPSEIVSQLGSSRTFDLVVAEVSRPGRLGWGFECHSRSGISKPLSRGETVQVASGAHQCQGS